MNTLGILAFVVALLASVMVHEAGHFLTARAFGMKATQFFVGFGPTLWSVRRGETEYGVKAIPAGGFVKIIGMIPEEEIAEEDQPRAFWRFEPWKRTVVLAAGSTTHFLIGGMLILGAAFFAPIATARPVVQTVSTCVSLDEQAPLTTPAQGCGPHQVGAPAAGALKAGDRLVSVDGVPISSWDKATDAIRGAVTEEDGRYVAHPLAIVVERQGAQVPVTITPVVSKLEGDATFVGRIGVTPHIAYPTPGYHEGLHRAGTIFGVGHDSLVQSLGRGFANIPSRFGTIFDKDRPSDGPQSVVGIARGSGEILATSAEPLSSRIWTLLLVIGSVNIFVGILNLFPLLPFDGGHIALIAADKVRATFARVRRRPAPARIKYSTVAPLSYAVFLVITLASLTVLSADVVNPVHL